MTKALIIGGGIAGPAVAMALQRAGITAAIYEAHSQAVGEVGSYLTIATNGLDALRAIDLERSVLETGFESRYNILLSDTGRRLGVVSNGGMLPGGIFGQTFKRARLHQLLQRSAKERGIPMEFNKRLASAESTPEGVLARFADGTTAQGDILVGCDGVNSTVRCIISPDAPAPRYCGLVNFGGYTQGLNVGASPGNWYMIFGKRAFFGYVVDPSGGIAWFANVARKEVSDTERSATSAEQWKRQLLEIFSSDNAPATKLIEAGELQLVGDNTFDVPTVPMWHRGRMIIVGDAAHAPQPTSGQGASMACEDAVVLAKCLRDTPDPQHAFIAYEQLRRRRVERIVAQAARTASTKMPGIFGRTIRNLMLPLVFRFLVTEESQRWIFGHHIEWDATPAHEAT